MKAFAAVGGGGGVGRRKLQLQSVRLCSTTRACAALHPQQQKRGGLFHSYAGGVGGVGVNATAGARVGVGSHTIVPLVTAQLGAVNFVSTTPASGHGHGHSHSGEHGSIEITYKYLKDGSTKKVEAFIGDNLLRCAQSHGVELEGACECSIACSTCHVVLEDDLFDELPEPTEEEDDMLDMAFGLTPTSRLGCQVIITEDMDGMVVEIPAATRNMYVDGHVPQPH